MLLQEYRLHVHCLAFYTTLHRGWLQAKRIAVLSAGAVVVTSALAVCTVACVSAHCRLLPFHYLMLMLMHMYMHMHAHARMFLYCSHQVSLASQQQRSLSLPPQPHPHRVLQFLFILFLCAFEFLCWSSVRRCLTGWLPTCMCIAMCLVLCVVLCGVLMLHQVTLLGNLKRSA